MDMLGEGEAPTGMGTVVDLMTGEADCPEANAPLLALRGGVIACASALPIWIARAVWVGSCGGLPCNASQKRFLVLLDVCHL